MAFTKNSVLSPNSSKELENQPEITRNHQLSWASLKSVYYSFGTAPNQPPDITHREGMKHGKRKAPLYLIIRGWKSTTGGEWEGDIRADLE